MSRFVPASITELSDDVLLLIFSNLKSWDLLNLSQTCERFSKVASDKSLWINVDFSDGVLSLQQLKRCLVFLRCTTRQLVLRGHKRKYAKTPKWKTPLISDHLLKLIGEKCPHLEELTISEAYVDASKLKVADFSPVQSLLKFSLVDCEFVNLPSPIKEGSYFKKTHKILPNLKCLEICKCGWVEDYDVMVLSKVDTLKKLVLRNLPKVGSAIAYIALSFRFGFQNLEELDMRGTSLQDNEVLSVVQNNKLRALYLGPLGPVKRPTEDPLGGRNLIMPDPRWQEERQQVVVINVGPNGPQWRQVNDEELDGMGLEWVRNAPVAKQQREEQEDEDRHYFIDKDGRPIQEDDEVDNSSEGGELSEGESDSEQQVRGVKRQHPRSDVEPSSKKLKINEQESKVSVQNNPGRASIDDMVNNVRKEQQLGNQEDEDEGEADEEEFGPYCKDPEEIGGDESLQCQAYQPPDEFLSDTMVRAFGPKTKDLHTLVVSGCAISDLGLQQIIRLIPSLRLLDVTNTKVTNGAVQEARVARPDCVILGGGTRITRHQKNR
ncbi:hypothetical protein Pcinc_016910 [Petrolisthes cinctipes]|uniref:F-box domain-containing protein n=1 Tax=Petrolisthes cinctipes TaxID=88211 RepID=A0AAE1FRT6_PETCI|nr:hypothetical protein Pcinc_019644 [Petrolisthes cinctipes]KAK3878450.1 hypothetical protein Pcinc_016910 [Petrolisthes cinctipes]